MSSLWAVSGGVTAPSGFLAAGVACGIKRRGKDLALLFSERPAAAAGMLTTNRMKAPCVSWAAELIRRGRARAIVANSGNANCCTGKRGEKDSTRMAEWAGREMGIPPREVFVASTGVIGPFLPMDRVRKGIRHAAAALSRTGSLSTAEAIMTTDTRPKEIALRFRAGRAAVTVGGIAKGSGMVAPRLAPPPGLSAKGRTKPGGGVATMLAFLTTDAQVNRAALRAALRRWVPQTFNAITVDGETSTNDMVLFLANGASEVPVRPGTSAWRLFDQAVGAVCRHLSHEIVRDGEGVTRIFTVRVTGGTSSDQARRVAGRVANSSLVRTMVAGRDPNWGRIAAAAGASGAALRPERMTIRLGNVTVFRRGEPARLSREILLEQVDRPEVEMRIDLGNGDGCSEVLSGDLTEGYVRINAKYTS